MARAKRILIVGGGIGGLSLAAALRREGFMPSLIERSPVWRTVGAGIAMQPNGIRVLHEWGWARASISSRAGLVRRHRRVSRLRA